MQSACFQIVANVQVLYMSAPATTTTATTTVTKSVVTTTRNATTTDVALHLKIHFRCKFSRIQFVCKINQLCVLHDMPAERLQMD